jgi:transketolase
LEGIYNAIVEARRERNKPTLIRLTTTIGYGSKQQGTHGVHGSREYKVSSHEFENLNASIALKADDIAALKTKVGFNPSASFYVPDEVYATWAVVGERGSKLESQWNSLLSSYASAFPSEHAAFTRRIAGKLPDNWEKSLPVYKATDPAQASRKLSEIVLTAIIPALPDLLGGSADLTGSNLTKAKGTVDFQPDNTGLGTYKGTYIRFGVREHGMGAIANGIAAYGGIIPFVGTFMNFVSYAAGAVRLAALSKHQVIWVGEYISTRDDCRRL